MGKKGGGTTGGTGGTGGTTPTTATRTFNYVSSGETLQAKMRGSINLAQGGTVDTWYFGSGFNGDRQWAGPVIEGIEGQEVSITLTSARAHTIHFHGLDVDQANDGTPATSGYVSNGKGNSLFGRVEGYVNLGSSFTYRFIAPHAGTYHYHCHVDTPLHYDMGMHGTVIIRPANGSATDAWEGGPTFSKEYVWQLGTFDTSWRAVDVSGPVTARYRPDCFMINGRNGADAQSDPTVAVTANAGDKVLIRVNQSSFQSARIELGGLPFEVIASDGRPLPAPLTKTSLYASPGERYDLLVTMPAAGTRYATVSYYDNRGANVISSVVTTLTSV